MLLGIQTTVYAEESGDDGAVVALDGTEQNRPNDTRKPAAYIVKAALDPEKLVAGSSVWCFSDILRNFLKFGRISRRIWTADTQWDTETCLLCYENAGRIV